MSVVVKAEFSSKHWRVVLQPDAQPDPTFYFVEFKRELSEVKIQLTNSSFILYDVLIEDFGKLTWTSLNSIDIIIGQIQSYTFYHHHKL